MNLKTVSGAAVELSEVAFGRDFNEALVHQVVTAYLAAGRAGTKAQKNRAAVSGGGKKPWKQKGTGRARHGSSRSPIWVGGGVTFGPRNDKNPSLKVNKKEKHAALRMVLSDKLKNGRLIVVDSWDQVSGKTRDVATLLSTVAEARPAVLSTAKSNALLTRAAANLPRTNTVLADSLSVGTLLKYRYLVVDNAGVDAIIALLNKDKVSK